MPLGIGKFDAGTIEATLQVDTDKFRKGMKKSRTVMNRVGEAAAATGAVVGTMAATLGGAAVKAAADFESAMVTAGTKVDATAQTLERMEEAAISAGQQSKFSAQKAARAMTFLGKAGLTASQQIEAVPGTLQLATAASVNLSKAAQIATGTVKGFGLEMQELGRVNDVLVATTNEADASVSELSQAFSVVSSQARAYGFSLEETSAAIGVLSDRQIKASKAGTGLRGVILQLQKASKELGADLSFQQIKQQSLVETLRDLKDAGLSAKNASKIFGREASSVAQVLLQATGEVENFTQSLKNAGGRAEQVADKKLKTLNNKFNILVGSIETLAIKAAKTEPFKNILDNTTKLVNALSEMPGLFDKIKTGLEALPVAIFDAAGAKTLGEALKTQAIQAQDEALAANRRQAVRQAVAEAIRANVDPRTGETSPFVGAQTEQEALKKARSFDDLGFTELAPAVQARATEISAKQRARRRNAQNFNPRTTLGGFRGSLPVGGIGDVEQSTEKGIKEGAKEGVKQGIIQSARGRPSKITAGPSGKAAAGIAAGLPGALAGAARGARGAAGIAQASRNPLFQQVASTFRQIAETGQSARTQLNTAADVMQNVNLNTKSASQRIRSMASAAGQGAQAVSQFVQSLGGQSKGVQAVGGIAGGVQQGVGFAGALGAAGAGGLVAGIGGGIIGALGIGAALINTFSDDGNKAQKRRMQKQMRRARKNRKEFTENLSERMSEKFLDGLEDRNLQPIVFQVDNRGSFHGSRQEAEDRLVDMMRSAVDRVPGDIFNRNRGRG